MLQSKKILSLFFSLFILTATLSPALSFDSVMKITGTTSFPKILVYLFDFVTILFLLLFGVNFRNRPRLSKTFIKFVQKNFFLLLFVFFFSFFAAASFLWSGSPSISLLLGTRMFFIAAAVFVAVFLIAYSKKLKVVFFLSLIFSSLFQSSLALGQLAAGESLGFGFLGESYLGREVLGLAKVTLGQESLLRAYGTLPHPNILGGFELFAIFVTLYFFFKKALFFSPRTYFLILSAQFLGLFISFSRTALSGLLILATVFFFKMKKVHSRIDRIAPVLIFFAFAAFLLRGLDSQSLWRSESFFLRTKLLEANWERFVSSPLIGRGWGSGPEELLAFSDFPFYFFEKQPVHNIFILVLADLGLIGMIVFCTLLAIVLLRTLKNKSYFAIGLIIFLPIGILDHYLLTLPTGMFIFFWLVFGFLIESKPRRRKITQ